MGCDIHVACEIYKDGAWHNIDKRQPNQYWYPTAAQRADLLPDDDGNLPSEVAERVYVGRNYALFGILTGGVVRRRFEAVVLFDEPRGMPGDAAELTEVDVGPRDADLHSHSYLTLAELLEFDWDQEALCYHSWVSLSAYCEFKRTGVWPENCELIRWEYLDTVDTDMADLYSEFIASDSKQEPEEKYRDMLKQLVGSGRLPTSLAVMVSRLEPLRKLSGHFWAAERPRAYFRGDGRSTMDVLQSLAKEHQVAHDCIRIVFSFEN